MIGVKDEVEILFVCFDECFVMLLNDLFKCFLVVSWIEGSVFVVKIFFYDIVIVVGFDNLFVKKGKLGYV